MAFAVNCKSLALFELRNIFHAQKRVKKIHCALLLVDFLWCDVEGVQKWVYDYRVVPWGLYNAAHAIVPLWGLIHQLRQNTIDLQPYTATVIKANSILQQPLLVPGIYNNPKGAGPSLRDMESKWHLSGMKKNKTETCSTFLMQRRSFCKIAT